MDGRIDRWRWMYRRMNIDEKHGLVDWSSLLIFVRLANLFVCL